MMMDGNSHAEFTGTSWTLIDDLASDDSNKQHRALDIMIRRYWPPVYAMMRRQGCGRDEAEEIVQGFFADKVVARDLFTKADPKRGKLRSLICSAVQRYAIDQQRREAARGLGRKIPIADIDREENLLRSDPQATAEQMFERRWATAMLEEAMNRSRERLIKRGLDRHWEAWRMYHLQPHRTGNGAPSQKDIAEQLGFPNGNAVAVAIQTVNKEIRLALREVIRETTADPADAEAEYQRIKDGI